MIEEVEKNLARSKKICSLKEAKFIGSIDYGKIIDLKYILNKLKTLRQLNHIGTIKQSELEFKQLREGAERTCKAQNTAQYGTVGRIPEHLVCPITNAPYEVPVMIESGKTYEKSYILRHFEIHRERAANDLENGESSQQEEDYYFCPITR